MSNCRDSINIYSAVWHETFNFFNTHGMLLSIASFAIQHENISQGSAAIYLRCGGTCYIILLDIFTLFNSERILKIG